MREMGRQMKAFDGLSKKTMKACCHALLLMAGYLQSN